VQTGVYGWIRHPLYVSVMLAGFGWSLIWQSLPALVVGCLQIPFFVAKASREEGWLHHAFPEYASYARRVKRFVPGIY
jgi:protein-S-isoprenylcysteine O-methyltransferase Ste14